MEPKKNFDWNIQNSIRPSFEAIIRTCAPCTKVHSCSHHPSQWRIQELPQEVRQSIIWTNVSQKLHENERISTERGHTSLAPPWIHQLIFRQYHY